MHSYEFLIPIALFIVIAYIFKVIAEHKTRNKLIEKGLVDENVKHLFLAQGHNILSSLKWGMVLVGVGIAFLIGHFVPEDISHEVTASSALILAGLALLIFYFIEAKKENR
ncbi:MAG: hypothetical protein GF315_04950 [candidate division Zixibacteria bacterium]|nr:hypothetical protein [candidate division Zixibacteria bacterium]